MFTLSEEEPTPAPATPSLWTAPQRRAIWFLLVLISIGLLVQTVRRRIYVPENRATRGAGAQSALQPDDRIDPNQADWQTLACIPSLGERRAQLIVAYRQQFLAAHGAGARAYQSPADLAHVRGIASATISNMEPYLVFPSAPVPDRPAPAR